MKSAIPAGGILNQHVDSDFADFIAGRPATQRVCISVVQVGAVHSSNQEKGRSNKASYETVHLVEVSDPHQADQLRHLLTQLRADRGLMAKQPALFDATEEEQRESLLDMIKDWASENDTPMADVDQKWVEYFGGAEHAQSETVQASRSVLQLKEFALYVGAITDGPGDEQPDDTSGVEAPAFSDESDGTESAGA